MAIYTYTITEDGVYSSLDGSQSIRWNAGTVIPLGKAIAFGLPGAAEQEAENEAEVSNQDYLRGLGSVTRPRLAADVAADLTTFDTFRLALAADARTPLISTYTYTRTDMNVAVVGLNGTKLYGKKLDNGHWATSVDAGVTWVDRTYSPSSALPTGFVASQVTQLIFSDTYMFACDDTYRLVRAPIDVFNTWTDIKGPWATNTTARPDVLAWNGTSLIYGGYNGSTPWGAYVYRSQDNGATWDTILSLPEAKHTHAVHVDGDALWVTVGDFGTSPAFSGEGLYYCPDVNVASPTFTYLSGNMYGINLVIPPATPGIPRRIIMEGDGRDRPFLMSYPYNQKDAPGASTAAAVWWDGKPADALGSWRGTTRGICLTSEGHIFFCSTSESGAVGTRNGVWVSPGPWYNRAVLLEELTAIWGFGKTFEVGEYLFNWKYKITKPTFLLP